MDASVSQVREVLSGINDPEMPISIVDLGMIDDVAVDGSAATIRVLPTFVGCPALEMIRDEIVSKTSALAGIDEVRVDFVFDPPWSPERISDAGREQLREIGVTVPLRTAAARPECGGCPKPEAVACPYCGDHQTRLESSFGPTRCRMIYYCEACKNPFEHMKQV